MPNDNNPNLGFKEIEEKYKAFWEKEGVYKYKGDFKKVYSVDTPPPTVSGKMHIGHAFSYSQQDFIVRFKRMLGRNVFYPFGTDDNGLPTERLIERMNNIRSKDMSRAKFIELCLKTLKKVTPEFIQEWKTLGISCDYDTRYSTIDDNSRKISQKLFIDLYKKGRAYKKDFPTIWCPECQTSIAQAELEDKEEPSLFSTIKFSVNGKDLLIATTRPELLGACVAVFVNPKDKRYSKIIGKKAQVPLFDYEVSILADESADIEKGTGAMMICSYGDKFDVDAIHRHKLTPRVIFDKDGTLNIKGYEGFKIRDARKKILEDLKKQDLIKEQKSITHIVNVHDKCGTAIEFLPTEQWFIKILDKKKKFISQAKKIHWYPKYMFKRYENWVNGLEWDWNISRDRHFGVAIPIWYCNKCNEIILADEKELPVDPIQLKKKCPKCKGDAIPEEKVLDTWATSSLTPYLADFLTENKVRIPFSLRPQGHDIIRTWAFYTIVRSFFHEDDIPWKDIIISGNVSLGGEKMSKSKGNVIDPKSVLNTYGSDALRFWAAGSKLGKDLDYQEKDLIAGKKFINKLTNASKFVFMNLESYKLDRPKKLNLIDDLFLKKLQLLINLCTDSFQKYEYSKVKFEVEQFFWKDFCDNYLEIVKKRIYQGQGEDKLSAQYTLYYGLLSIIKLIAPIMPFITEHIYQEYFKRNEQTHSLHISNWPEIKRVEMENDCYDVFIDTLSKIRSEKTKNQRPMNSEILLTLNKGVYDKLKGLLEDLKSVTNAKEIRQGTFKVEFK